MNKRMTALLLAVLLCSVSLSTGIYTVKTSGGVELFKFEVTTQTSSAWIASASFTSNSGYGIYNSVGSLVKSW